MDINVEFDLQSFNRDVDNNVMVMKKELNRIVLKAVRKVLDDVRTTTKHGDKTFNLRNGWTSTPVMQSKIIGYLIRNPMFYASFIEDGTKVNGKVRIRARNMLKDAIADAEKQVNREVNALLWRMGGK